ncbi:hypothetical protein N0V92_006414 [Colletotrichum tropicale]|nr:hypothetical protein N0V92_006414 [Colletotrichum tropicale]
MELSAATKKHGSVEAKWKRIWLILFPDTKEESIPSPYFETSEVESAIASLFDARECEEYVRSHLDPMIFSWFQKWLERATEQAKQELRIMIGEKVALLLHAFTEENITSSCECAPLDEQERHASEPSKPTKRVLESEEMHCETQIAQCPQTWEQQYGSSMQSVDEQANWDHGNEQSCADGDPRNLNEHSYGVFEGEGNDFNLDSHFDSMSAEDMVQVGESLLQEGERR